MTQRVWVGFQPKNRKTVVALLDVYQNVEVAIYLTANELAEMRDRITQYIEEEKKRASQGGVDSPPGSSGPNNQ